jgi:hypothetical protein
VIAALDLSAETPGAWIPLRQIEERAGRELAQARADLAVLTMTVKRHFGRSSWPFVQEWAAGAMGANERARQPGRTRLAGSVRTAVNDPHRSAAAPRASISAAGIDDEIERSPLNDRSIATNHPADRPRFAATRVGPLQQAGRQAEASGARVRASTRPAIRTSTRTDGRGRSTGDMCRAHGRQQSC